MNLLVCLLGMCIILCALEAESKVEGGSSHKSSSSFSNCEGESALHLRLKKISSQELLILQKKISMDKQKYYSSILKEYLHSKLVFYIKQQDYVKIIEGIEFSCSLSYLTGMTYVFQEHIVRLAYKVFNMPKISENEKNIFFPY